MLINEFGQWRVFFKKKKLIFNCFWKMERFFSKKINLIYFGKWRDLGSLTYNSPSRGEKKKEKKKRPNA